MSVRSDFFNNPDIMVVLTTSTAGLGHKRVTAALEQGLPEIINEEELGSDNPKLQFLHRLASINVPLRWLIERVQNTPAWDSKFARAYSWFLRRNPEKIYLRLKDLIDRRNRKPKTVLIVCSHFSMAHSLAAIKKRLAKATKTKIVLAVIVTDDSPQKIWAVAGADYIFVPSHRTKNDLKAHINKHDLKPIPELVVTPYPVSLDLGQKLSKEEFEMKLKQVTSSKHPIKIMIPISGAAVQQMFLKSMVNNLCRKECSAVTMVMREYSSTSGLIKWGQNNPLVNVIAKSDDRDVVEEYEQEYMRNVYALEITKPSEQTFKVLLTPKQRGGVIMLFSKSVGRQEDDNIRFMNRHGLLPNTDDAETIVKIARGRRSEVDDEFLKRARKWRGIILPLEGKKAGKLIKKLKKLGVFEAMMNFEGFMDHEELRSDGVEKIWEYLEKKLVE